MDSSENSHVTQIKKVWRTIVSAGENVPMAVVIFNHGIEKFQLLEDSDEHRAQIEKTLRDFGDKLVGIYDRRVDFATFKEDVLFAMEQLST